ncbi:MAG TPA: SIS domain-containing protein [Bryobacteraceae bacterium]|nr:SIS domain-containing protein [Bryobacteraceae bacterium]
MPIDFSIIEGDYLRDLLSQPESVRNTLANLRATTALERVAQDLASGRFRRTVLTGMGGSYHALYPLYLQLVNCGRPVLLVETSELLGSMAGILDGDTLLIVASQSGRSAETVRMVDFGAWRPYVIGITNTPDSPLARKSDVMILTHAGAESSVSCKTYVATLTAVEWAAAVLCGIDLDETEASLARAIPAMEQYLAKWREHVQSLSAELAGTDDVFVTGRGTSLAAAGTGGLILKESTHLHAEGMSSAAFRHGPFEMLSGRVFVLVFEGSSTGAHLNAVLVKDIREAGGRASLVSENAVLEVFRLPAVPDVARPLIEMLPVQMMSLVLAAQRGHEPGRFQLATKITTVE